MSSSRKRKPAWASSSMRNKPRGELPGGEVGTLALGFQSTAGLSVVPQLLQRFRTSYPDVDVLLREMGTSAQITALRAGELDVALMYSLGSEEFAYRELVPESLVDRAS